MGVENLGSILAWKYPGGDWEVRRDSPRTQPYIATWNVPGVPQPTVAEVLALEPAWQTYLATPDQTADQIQISTKVLSALIEIAASRVEIPPRPRPQQWAIDIILEARRQLTTAGLP